MGHPFRPFRIRQARPCFPRPLSECGWLYRLSGQENRSEGNCWLRPPGGIARRCGGLWLLHAAGETCEREERRRSEEDIGRCKVVGVHAERRRTEVRTSSARTGTPHLPALADRRSDKPLNEIAFWEGRALARADAQKRVPSHNKSYCLRFISYYRVIISSLTVMYLFKKDKK